ncbi:MAG: DUF4124 domain-containing protein [Oceanobacter sp.]
MRLWILLLLGISVSSLAQVYRWVDEQGQVHFGSQPPEQQLNSAENYRLRVPSSAQSAPAAAEAKDGTEGQMSASPEQVTAETKNKVSAEKAAEYCQQARQNKKILSSNSSRRFQQADGSFRPLTDDERSQTIKKTDDVIQQYCQ